MEALKSDMKTIFLDNKNNFFVWTGEYYFEKRLDGSVEVGFDFATSDELFEKLYKKCFEGRIDSPLKQSQAPVNFSIAKSVIDFTKSFFIKKITNKI